MAEDQGALDIANINVRELPTGEFPAPEEWELFRVHIAPEVHRVIRNHAQESRTIELGGFLVGELRKDAKGPFLSICASIRGEHAEHQAAQVTFTQETWAHAYRELDTKYCDSKIAGWYHTHPGFGVFLSPQDLFIHEHFFNSPHQVAFVIDPRSEEEGFFCWKKGKVAQMRHYWVGETEKVLLPTAAAGEVGNRLRRLEEDLLSFKMYSRERLDSIERFGKLVAVCGIAAWLLVLAVAVAGELKPVRDRVGRRLGASVGLEGGKSTNGNGPTPSPKSAPSATPQRENGRTPISNSITATTTPK